MRRRTSLILEFEGNKVLSLNKICSNLDMMSYVEKMRVLAEINKCVKYGIIKRLHKKCNKPNQEYRLTNSGLKYLENAKSKLEGTEN